MSTYPKASSVSVLQVRPADAAHPLKGWAWWNHCPTRHYSHHGRELTLREAPQVVGTLIGEGHPHVSFPPGVQASPHATLPHPLEGGDLFLEVFDRLTPYWESLPETLFYSWECVSEPQGEDPKVTRLLTLAWEDEAYAAYRRHIESYNEALTEETSSFSLGVLEWEEWVATSEDPP